MVKIKLWYTKNILVRKRMKIYKKEENTTSISLGCTDNDNKCTVHLV